MKKRIFAAALALLLLCSGLLSCGKSPGPRYELTVSGDFFIYHDLYFYKAPKVKGDMDTRTLKYIRLTSDETVGASVYSNVLNDEGDPFQPEKNGEYIGESDIVVDEEATEKNDGVPVLIALLPFEKEGEDISSYRVSTYNMATGQMKELCGDVGNSIISFGVYGDTVYYVKFDGKWNVLNDAVDGTVTLYSLPKAGGEPEALCSVENNFLYLQASWNGKLYIKGQDTCHIYCFDPVKKTLETVSGYERERQFYFYVGGYVYYKGNFRTVKKDGFKDLTVFDLYRQPLEDLKDLTDENGERILENLYTVGPEYGTKICYGKADETRPFGEVQFDDSILYEYDVETKESGLVYDHSDRQGIQWSVYAANADYLIMYSYDEELNNVWPESIVDRKTGERREIEDFRWF